MIRIYLLISLAILVQTETLAHEIEHIGHGHTDSCLSYCLVDNNGGNDAIDVIPNIISIDFNASIFFSNNVDVFSPQPHSLYSSRAPPQFKRLS